MPTLANTFIPELEKSHRGSVRDIYQKADELVLIASDRISCYDCVLKEQIPHKGRVLTEISAYWFDATKDIIPNHLVAQPDPNVLIARKCRPILVEVIVRGYLTGSLWKAYEKGFRTKCGVMLPDGLKKNDPLPQAILTPTTKNHHGHDEDITPEEIVSKGLATSEIWKQIEQTSLKLFERGQTLAKERGLILVDTKYEFGLNTDGDLVLIDEIHTPDSSRFWYASDHEAHNIEYPDKQFVRDWLAAHDFTGEGTPPPLPQEVIDECSQRYLNLYETVLGRPFVPDSAPAHRRIVNNLTHRKTIKGCFALVVMGSEKDQTFVEKIETSLRNYGIPSRSYVASAQKTLGRVNKLIEQYNASMEPLICISVAGLSNALSGVLAANLKWPVISCPPFKDQADYLVNIHSSLQMPSQTPVLTVVDPGNAALAAYRILSAATDIPLPETEGAVS